MEIEPRKNDAEYPADTLGMPAAEMRRLGYRVVDLVVDRLASRSRESVMVSNSLEKLADQLGGDIPTAAGDAEQALMLLAEVALHHQQHGDHPRYFARVPGPSSFGAVLGEWLATGFNTIAASWAGGSGPATIELVVTDWLRQLMGMPPETEGVLVSGGSMANLTGIAAARATCGAGIVYLTEQAHSSIKRALTCLGFPDGDVRVLTSDDHCRMPIKELRNAITRDTHDNRHPFMVIATAGTTNTGAVDPLNAIAELCREYNMWFHIDGAYGAPAALCEQGRSELSGIEKADSLVLDPHKWFFQPYDVGCVLVRRPNALANAFSMTPEYLKDVKALDEEVDFRDRSPELSRRSRATKLWMTFHTYGVERIRSAILKCIALAEYAEDRIRRNPNVWKLVSPAQLGIVTFALKDAAEGEHAIRAKRLAETGYAAVSSTRLKGKETLRLCTINPLTTERDIDGTLEELSESLS